MAGEPVPRAAAAARTGQQFQHRGPRRARCAHSPAGARGSREWPRGSGGRLGAGRGPGGLEWRRLLPSHLPYLPPWPRSRPRGVSLPGQAGVQAVSAGGEQSSGVGQLHHTWWMQSPRRSRSRRSGDRHPRRRRAQAAPAACRSRPLPWPPGWLAPSSAASSGRWDQPSARGSREARPARATGRREEGTVTWGWGFQRCRLRGAWLGVAALPGPPYPLAPAEASPPARVHAPLGAWRSELPAECKPEGRKAGGRRSGWVGGWSPAQPAGFITCLMTALAA